MSAVATMQPPPGLKLEGGVWVRRHGKLVPWHALLGPCDGPLEGVAKGRSSQTANTPPLTPCAAGNSDGLKVTPGRGVSTRIPAPKTPAAAWSKAINDVDFHQRHCRHCKRRLAFESPTYGVVRPCAKATGFQRLEAKARAAYRAVDSLPVGG